MLAFTLAVMLLVSTPGPGVLSTAGVGSAFGYRPGLAYVVGLWIGNLMVSLMVISGLAALIFSIPGVRAVLLVASVAYLAYLAARIALSGSKIAFIESASALGAMNGFLLQFINPKAYVVSTTLFSGFAFMPDAIALEVTIKLLIFNAIWIPIHLIWLWAGVAVRRLELAPHIQRSINVGMAVAMLAVVGLALWSQMASG
ncbi:MAG: LysE family transporter [Pseudomonadota bacterium]